MFLVQSHYSHTMGGAEYRCKILIDQMIKKDEYDIGYICVNCDPKFVPEGYKIHKFGNRLTKYGSFFGFFNLINTLKIIEPDIIYQNGGSAYTGIAAFYAKKYNAKLVFQICNDNNLKAFSSLRIKTRVKKFVDDIFFKYGVNNANVIVGQSSRQNELLLNRFGRPCHSDGKDTTKT